MSKIDEMREALRVAEAEERQRIEEAKRAFKMEMRYTIEPTANAFDKLYDEACCLYRIEGVCLNSAEAAEVGVKPHEGGMNYLFNIASGHIVMSVGGGSVYIDTYHSEPVVIKETFDEIGRFLVKNPEGGDITEIIKAHRARNLAATQR